MFDGLHGAKRFAGGRSASGNGMSGKGIGRQASWSDANDRAGGSKAATSLTNRYTAKTMSRRTSRRTA